MGTTPVRRGRYLELQSGQYGDGHPLDEVHYLECKLILKPDRFKSAKVFLEYGELVAQTAKKFGINFINKGVVLKPQIAKFSFSIQLISGSTTMPSYCAGVSATKMAFPQASRKSFLNSVTRIFRKLLNWMYVQRSPAIIASNSKPRPCRSRMR